MKRPWVIVLSVAVAIVVVVGVLQSGGSGSTPSGNGPTNEAAQKALAGSPPRLAALHADASRLLPADGYAARLRALRGLPVVVNVWGAWCGPCREEFPIFQRVSVKRGRSVAFLGVDTQDSEAAASKFLRGHPVSYPSYQDFDGKIARQRYGLTGTPDTIFYDRSGKVAYVHQGPYRSDAYLDADIKRYAGA